MLLTAQSIRLASIPSA